ncbi:WG repeat-containing protein [Psychrobacter sp. FBL11]|uniref:WG repeat-containing protein n=1 Tax=Psychrobacter saeujeotis TaxID=3143436 RepID=A0ABU9X6H2_9GAMM|nr:WG repeat-containing protein [uncultured Psychrobacter sp.]
MSQRSILKRSTVAQILLKRQSVPLSAPTLSLFQGVRLSLMAGILLSTVSAMPIANAASCKIPKSYYKNVSCTSTNGYYLAITDFGAPVALINSKGKRVVDLSRYQKVDANNMAGGLLPVLRHGRVGYINMQGREVVPTIYEMFKGNGGWARPVSEGRIIVKRNGDYGVIGTGNQTIVPFSSTITDIDDYRGGVARIRRNQSTSWLDKNGKTTSDPNAKEGNSGAMSATAQTQQPRSTPFTTLQPHQQDGRWGFVDDKNVTMITYSFDEVRPFSEGLAAVRLNDKWGFVNLGGELVIPFRFEDSGLIAVTDNNSNKDISSVENEGSVKDESNLEDESSIKDTSAKKPTTFIFKDNKAWVGNLKDGSKICIDKKGDNVSCE